MSGNQYAIRTDFRDILKIITAFNDPNLEENEKAYVCLYIFYEDFESIPQTDYEAAFKSAIRFIDNNTEDPDENKNTPHIMDWEQDEAIMFPAINKVAGYETRSAEYIHWWTFLGYYMEISEGIYSNVLNIRMKKAKHKALDKWEREFWNSNKKICVLKTRLSDEEQAAKDRLNALLG